MNQALIQNSYNLAPLAPIEGRGRGYKPEFIMKKTIKHIVYFLLFVYWSFACYDHFKHIGDHARDLMELVGAAGGESIKMAKGAIR